MISPTQSPLFRAERVFENAQRMRERFVLPTKVFNWMQENYDQLFQLYNLCRDFAETTSSPILDRSDFHSFCACIARLSDVDFRGFDYPFVWDYLDVKPEESQTSAAVPPRQTGSEPEPEPKSTAGTSTAEPEAGRSG